MSKDAAHRLKTLARDLWWTWQPDGPAFFADLDPTGWHRTRHNPVAMLADALPGQYDELPPALSARLAALEAARAQYLSARGQGTWHDRAGAPLDAPVAYFSAEFGLHESLPMYSGGLGVLAGDHTKSASDLDLPFIGVGLLYRQGYVRQAITADGRQENLFEDDDFDRRPVERICDEHGQEVRISVELGSADVQCRVWRALVGRTSLILLDTDLPENAPELRTITARLYGGDHLTRIRQEIVLGVGGVRALAALGIEPSRFHLNEGHSAFLVLERARRALIAHEAPDAIAALARGREQNVFTTHTPVEAGHDRFAGDVVFEHLHRLAEVLGLDREGLLALGRWPDDHMPDAPFNMTLLALRTCSRANGVAALHGAVSRQMFARLWPALPLDEVPVTHITNGVHAPTWLAPAWRAALSPLFPVDEALPTATDPRWARVKGLDDAEFWRIRRDLKCRLFALAETRAVARAERLGLAHETLGLDPDALTIGFARRFAPYKRSTLLFHDLERFRALIAAAPGPVQFLFAGKAHPADEAGRALVHEVFRHAGTEPARIVLIEGYDIELGRALTQGVDVWLNTPRRPMEASGTSGMKAGMNGALNLSVLDGWWPEGYDGENGWAFGEARPYETEAAQDAADAQTLYTLLENEVLPLYYQRDEAGLPRGWLRRLKGAMATIIPRFNTDRQVQDYLHHVYAPG
jgi:starch phosphorylase